jgi:cytochrome c biogenesis protein CcmG/thiol:disulfide interchange protein DsbE
LLAVCASSGDEPRCAPGPFRQFLSENKVDFFAIRDDANRTNALYGTVMFPETYIIDSQGIVRRKFIGAVDWTKPEILDYLRRIG